MSKRTVPEHRVRIDGGKFVVHNREGRKLYAGTYQEVEIWLDQRENCVRPQPPRPRTSFIKSILKIMRRTTVA